MGLAGNTSERQVPEMVDENHMDEPKEDRKFEAWMDEVNAILVGAVGIESDDLPDWNYRDAYDDGADPRKVVHEVLEENGWEEE